MLCPTIILLPPCSDRNVTVLAHGKGWILLVLAVVPAQPIPVPSDRGAKYTALQVTPKPGELVEILSRRVGPSGTCFAVREVDCRNDRLRYLGEGDTRAEAPRRKDPPWPMADLLDGSIAWHVSHFACHRAASAR